MKKSNQKKRMWTKIFIWFSRCHISQYNEDAFRFQFVYPCFQTHAWDAHKHGNKELSINCFFFLETCNKRLLIETETLIGKSSSRYWYNRQPLYIIQKWMNEWIYWIYCKNKTNDTMIVRKQRDIGCILFFISISR